MPVYLRTFYFKELIKTKEEENKKMKKEMSKSKKPNMPSKNRNPRFKR